MTHTELVERAVRWLGNTKKCNPVLAEPQFDERRCAERPDAIGWDARTSYLVECKVSLGDFYADRRKPHRITAGLGRFRYYLIPPGLLDDVPEPWGLLECCPRIIRVAKEAREAHAWNAQAEVAMLARLLARAQHHEAE